MLSESVQLSRIRIEVRKLRTHIAVATRSRIAQKSRGDKLESEVKDKEQKIRDLEKENQKLKSEIEEIKKQRDTYKGMIFKPNQVSQKILEEISDKKKKTRGGQTGHSGFGRKLPGKVDQTFRIFFHHCPKCKAPLKRSKAAISHTITDIPLPTETQALVTKYDSERQWCTNCQKEVSAHPSGVIPNCRLGVNLIGQVLVWKYRNKMPLFTIKDSLSNSFGVKISAGGIQQIFHRVKKYFGKNYEQLLKEIRGSPVKQADETSWRISGSNGWLWEFLTHDVVYYTIEETRGKGVPETILAGSKGTDVLVRDDYSSYQKLPINHQSCWAHLLRESRTEANLEFASKEVKALHQELGDIFAKLKEITNRPFDQTERHQEYLTYSEKLGEIATRDFNMVDAKKIQTRIKNQGNNLLTALLFPNVPLTNNHAERNIRPMVISRKISGGSRSTNGAETFAVNSSILQTIKLKHQPLYPTLRKLVLEGATGKN